MQNAVAKDPTNANAKSLLSLFLSYKITTDVHGEETVRDSVQAIDWLIELDEQHPMHRTMNGVQGNFPWYYVSRAIAFEMLDDAVFGAEVS